MESHVLRSPALLLVGFLAACAPPPRSVDVILSPPDATADLSSCGATELQALIGSPVASLPVTGDWQVMRIIQPGDAVTADFSETRLNVEVDDEDLILKISCG
jgi:hypothetical protein